MADFWAAGSEITDLAQELIGKYHPEIATADFAFLYKDKASAAEVDAGQVGVAKKVSGMWHTLTGGKDFVIVLTYSLWNDLSNVEQTAMLDMALESCVVKKDKDGEDKLDDDGNPEWAIKPYDIVGHSSIISRYGLDVFTKIGECTRAAMAKDKDDNVSDGADDDADTATSTTKSGKASKRGALLQ